MGSDCIVWIKMMFNIYAIFNQLSHKRNGGFLQMSFANASSLRSKFSKFDSNFIEVYFRGKIDKNQLWFS